MLAACPHLHAHSEGIYCLFLMFDHVLEYKHGAVGAHRGCMASDSGGTKDACILGRVPEHLHRRPSLLSHHLLAVRVAMNMNGPTVSQLSQNRHGHVLGRLAALW